MAKDGCGRTIAKAARMAPVSASLKRVAISPDAPFRQTLVELTRQVADKRELPSTPSAFVAETSLDNASRLPSQLFIGEVALNSLHGTCHCKEALAKQAVSPQVT
jgi:hypothetical protein